MNAIGTAAVVILGLIVLAAVVAAVWGVSSYNGLVARRERVRGAWGQIDVLLKRRHDLVPNLVETVKAYATHERETLSAVTEARRQAVAAPDPASQGRAEAGLTAALGRLMAVAEAYPTLRADANFGRLQEELATTENGIAARRSGYNDAVRDYNTAVQSLPTSLIAGPLGFAPEPFFELADPGQREAPAVKF